MAAVVVPTALLIVQLVEAAIPGAEALWAAIQNFHNQNPNLTPEQITAWTTAMVQSQAQRSAVIQALLAQIPDAPAKAGG
jgi:hypothetical protein